MTSDTKEHGEPVSNERLRALLKEVNAVPFPDSRTAELDSALRELLALRQRPTPERPPHQGLIEELRAMQKTPAERAEWWPFEKYMRHLDSCTSRGDQQCQCGRSQAQWNVGCVLDDHTTGSLDSSGTIDRAIAALEVQRPAITQELAVRSATVGGLEQFQKFRTPAGDTSETLRNCDRCGHEAMFVEPGHRFHNGLYIQVECSNTSCGIRTPPHYKTREDAAKAWNRNAGARYWSAPFKPDHSKPMYWVHPDGRMMCLARGEVPNAGEENWMFAAELV